MRLIKLAIVCAALLLYAAPAFADNGTSQGGYGGPPKIQADLDSATPTSASGGSLPFTGTDVSVLLIGGAAIGIVGFAVRRTSRSKR